MSKILLVLTLSFNLIFVYSLLKCKCRQNVEGQKCDHCIKGLFDYPSCNRSCKCSTDGSVGSDCDQISGDVSD